MLWKGDVCLKYRIVSVIPSLLETGCQLKSHDSAYCRVTLCSCVSIGWREWKKKGNKIKQISFCLLSTGSVSGWMTVTTYIPLWINGCASPPQNKRKPEELIIEMKSLCCQISCTAPRAEVWNVMALIEPQMQRLGLHVTVCPRGAPVAPARVYVHC